MLKTVLALLLFCVSSPVWAGDDSVKGDAASFDARLDLADQMLSINPPRDQVRAAIDTYINTVMAHAPELERQQFRTAMLTIVNHRALENLSREAYADLFTEGELRAMVEYYSKPEAISARAKLKEFNGRIYPEIIRMIDQALIRARTTAQ